MLDMLSAPGKNWYRSSIEYNTKLMFHLDSAALFDDAYSSLLHSGNLCRTNLQQEVATSLQSTDHDLLPNNVLRSLI